MTEIYRIEDEQGISCYNYKYSEALCNVLNDDYWCDGHEGKRPVPQEDKGIERKIWYKEICGFRNIKQALKWFNAKEIRKMRRLGLDIRKIAVQKITAIGECQILAIK